MLNGVSFCIQHFIAFNFAFISYFHESPGGTGLPQVYGLERAKTVSRINSALSHPVQLMGMFKFWCPWVDSSRINI